MSIIKKLLRKTLDISGLRGLNVLRNSEYLKSTGWFNSCKKKNAVDSSGNAIPWMPYPAIDFIERRLGKDMSVFAYGSGNSSIWLADRVGKVVSCEHDHKWHELVNKMIPENVHLVYRDLDSGEYIAEISKYRKEFDVIIIDGRERVKCVNNAVGALKDDGVIILDDSFREEYRAAKEFLRENGFKEIEIAGPTPIYFNASTSAIFYRSDNCFNI